MKHLLPSTVTVRRERERNLEEILGRREKRLRKVLLAKSLLGFACVTESKTVPLFTPQLHC